MAKGLAAMPADKRTEGRRKALEVRISAKKNLTAWAKAQGFSDLSMIYIEAVPPSFAALYLKAVRGESRSAGVKAQCLACVGYSRKEVRDCTAPWCSLWPYRPYQEKK